MSKSATNKKNANSSINAEEILDRIESFLLDTVKQKGQKEYYKTNKIAEQTNMKTKQVGAVIHRLNDRSESLSIEKWGRSKSTTWAIQRETETGN